MSPFLKVPVLMTFAVLWMHAAAVVNPKCPRAFRSVRFNDGQLQCFFVSGLSRTSDQAEKRCRALAPGSHLLSAEDRYSVVQFLVLVLGKMKYISHPLRTGLQCQNQRNCRFHNGKKKSDDIFQVKSGQGECVSLQPPHYLTGKFVPCEKWENFVCSVSAEEYSLVSKPGQVVEKPVTRTTYVPLGTCSGARSNHAKASLPQRSHIRIKGKIQKAGWCRFELSNLLNKDRILLINIRGEKTDFGSKLDKETWLSAVTHDKTAKTDRPKSLLPGEERFDMTIYRTPGNTYEVYVGGKLFQAFKSRVDLRPTHVDVCRQAVVDCVEVKKGRPEHGGDGKREVRIKTRTVDDMLNDAKRRKPSGLSKKNDSGKKRSTAFSLTDSILDTFPGDLHQEKEKEEGGESSQKKEKKKQTRRGDSGRNRNKGSSLTNSLFEVAKDMSGKKVKGTTDSTSGKGEEESEWTKAMKKGDSGKKKTKAFGTTDALLDVAKDMSREKVNETRNEVPEKNRKTTQVGKGGSFGDTGGEADQTDSALSGGVTKGRSEKKVSERRTDEKSEKKAGKERKVAEAKKPDLFNFGDDLLGGEIFENTKKQPRKSPPASASETKEIKEASVKASENDNGETDKAKTKKNDKSKKNAKAPMQFDFSDDLFSDMFTPEKKKEVRDDRCRGTSKKEYSRPIPVGWHARVRGKLQKSGIMSGYGELVFKNDGNYILKAYMRGGGIDFNSYTKRANFVARYRTTIRPKPPKSLLPFKKIVFEKFDLVVYRESERNYRTYVNGELYHTYKTSVNQTPTEARFSGPADVDCFEVGPGNPAA